MASTDLDIIIAGAGLSGIAAGYYVQSRLPGRSYRILEARDAIGGTWDLFVYPGVRSDSDMHTLGYSFRPWRGDIALADGPSIKAYIAETARELGIDRNIRYRRRVVRAQWSSQTARWTLDVEADSAIETYTCRFLSMCSGYYNYERGHLPQWTGVERYRGTIVHPQAWPRHLDCTGKRVIVIGSGATAVTLVPALAKTASHVTMVQRSPGYIVSLPQRDALARALNTILPSGLAHAAVRWKNVARQMLYYSLMRRYPEFARNNIKKMTRRELGTACDVDRHFTPKYNPWDQRLCFVPNSDLFASIRSGKASVVTDSIDEFTEHGVRLASGETHDADIIVTATGLDVQLLGATEIRIDGRRVSPSEFISYKGMMFCGVPNFSLALGYTNASWTLKCELTARYVCRLVRYMDRRGYAYCVPSPPDPSLATEPAISLTSGYIKRAEHLLPKQGSRKPWKLYQNYALDLASLQFGRLDDGVMVFARA
ncbi:MAG: NAD(P)/FAD-dependent oxidoreductase [Candidatus Eremiobacteraeota bacterium]|nr:NAD(P)/FAD-dependent oxidoreductase [Candidatus Eremiobacteraeota bacterium]